MECRMRRNRNKEYGSAAHNSNVVTWVSLRAMQPRYWAVCFLHWPFCLSPPCASSSRQSSQCSYKKPWCASGSSELLFKFVDMWNSIQLPFTLEPQHEDTTKKWSALGWLCPFFFTNVERISTIGWVILVILASIFLTAPEVVPALQWGRPLRLGLTLPSSFFWPNIYKSRLEQ